MEQQQAQFSSWAIVEVMGHQRFAGFVTTEAYGGAVLFRVDVPEVQGETDTETGLVRDGVPGFTKLIGAGSIYCITPCTEEAAKKATESMQYRPWKRVGDQPVLQLQGMSEEGGDDDEF